MQLKGFEEVLQESQDIEAGIYSAIGSQGKLNMMLGAKQFVRTQKGLKFTIKGAKNKINTILIELNGKDTYDVTFANFSIKNGWNVISKEDDVLNSQLKHMIETKTGKYLSLK